jgi:hypothetical protein
VGALYRGPSSVLWRAKHTAQAKSKQQFTIFGAEAPAFRQGVSAASLNVVSWRCAEALRFGGANGSHCTFPTKHSGVAGRTRCPRNMFGVRTRWGTRGRGSPLPGRRHAARRGSCVVPGKLQAPAFRQGVHDVAAPLRADRLGYTSSVAAHQWNYLDARKSPQREHVDCAVGAAAHARRPPFHGLHRLPVDEARTGVGARRTDIRRRAVCRHAEALESAGLSRPRGGRCHPLRIRPRRGHGQCAARTPDSQDATSGVGPWSILSHPRQQVGLSSGSCAVSSAARIRRGHESDRTMGWLLDAFAQPALSPASRSDTG